MIVPLKSAAEPREKPATRMENGFESQLHPGTIPRWPTGIVRVEAKWKRQMERLGMDRETTAQVLFILLVVLGILQVLPPLIRVYLMNVRAKRWKLLLFAIAFIALTFRLFARRRVRTDEDVVLTGSLRTNSLVKCVYLSGCYEPTLANFIQQTLKAGDVFVDVGANTGHFSLIAAKRGAEVIAVEASPANCRLFRQNIEANKLESRIRLVNAAAGNRKGTVRLIENRFNGMWSSTVPQVFWYLRPLTRTIVVPEISLDDMLGEENWKRIRFVKIDVEGAEPKVVRGLHRLIEYGRKDLEFCLEFSPHWLTSAESVELFDAFRSRGFTAYKLVNPEVDFRPYEIRRPVLCLAPPDGQVDLVFSRLSY